MPHPFLPSLSPLAEMDHLCDILQRRVILSCCPDPVIAVAAARLFALPQIHP